jgi:hypothetical protein
MDYVIDNLIDNHCTHYTVLTDGLFSMEFKKGDLLFVKKIEFNNCKVGKTYLFVFEDGTKRLCSIEIEYLGNNFTRVIHINNDDGQTVFTFESTLLGIFEIIVKISTSIGYHIIHTCTPISPIDYTLYHAAIAPKYYFERLPVIQNHHLLFPKKPLSQNVLMDIYMRFLNLPILFLKRIAKFYDHEPSWIENVLRGESAVEISKDTPPWITNLTIAELALMDIDIFRRYLRRTYKADPKHFKFIYPPFLKTVYKM